MTQIFLEDGRLVPVTVLIAGPCSVVQVKTAKDDGYDAVQLGFEDKKRRVSKPLAGHFKKSGVAPKRILREVRLNAASNLKAGDSVDVKIFDAVKRVDVIGISKGKGFQGTIKRHHFTRGPASHGSMNVRQPGSIGASADPSRVMKGMRMGGHMGHMRTTVKNLEVVHIDPENNLLLVKGSVPGPNGSHVMVRKTRMRKKAKPND
jgi:large subunit ribosomal protein L3